MSGSFEDHMKVAQDAFATTEPETLSPLARDVAEVRKLLTIASGVAIGMFATACATVLASTITLTITFAAVVALAAILKFADLSRLTFLVR